MNLLSSKIRHALLTVVIVGLIAVPVLILLIYQTVDADGAVDLFTSLSLNNKGEVIP